MTTTTPAEVGHPVSRQNHQSTPRAQELACGVLAQPLFPPLRRTQEKGGELLVEEHQKEKQKHTGLWGLSGPKEDQEDEKAKEEQQK